MSGRKIAFELCDALPLRTELGSRLRMSGRKISLKLRATFALRTELGCSLRMSGREISLELRAAFALGVRRSNGRLVLTRMELCDQLPDLKQNDKVMNNVRRS